MDIKEFKKKIETVLLLSRPIIQKLVDEKVIPATKVFIYKILQKKADSAIKRLIVLKEKALNETNETKRNAHLIGLKLGAEALIAIGEKLITAGKELAET